MSAILQTLCKKPDAIAKIHQDFESALSTGAL